MCDRPRRRSAEPNLEVEAGNGMTNDTLMLTPIAPFAPQSTTRVNRAHVTGRSSSSNRLTSTLPPLMMMPTRLPRSGRPAWRTGEAEATGGLDDELHALGEELHGLDEPGVARGEASASSRRMMAKVSSPMNWVWAPSAMVLGVGILTREPVRKDCWPSLPASGSTL
jgi:hypothetical protein